MATALVSEQRAHRRPVTMLAVDLRAANGSWPATIRNLSPQGALVQVSADLEIGAVVVLSRGSNHVAGEVRRRGAQGLGISFHEPITVPDWLQSIDSSSTSRTGNRNPHDRAREADTLSRATILCRVREEMAYISRLIEGVAGQLADDPILRVRHSSRIQELCMSEQMIQELAAILEFDCSADAVQTNATGPMRQRLLRASIVAVASGR